MSQAPRDAVYTLHLAKEDFKFSAAHFTLFGPDDAELLHGHNYQVEVELTGRRLDEEGLLVGFVEAKRAIRAACAKLDDHTLIPIASPHLKIRQEGDEIEVRFADRRYVLPRGDVLLLDEVNTSVEIFARLLWEDIAPQLDRSKVESMGVAVAETAGQACWYRASLT